MMLSIIENDFTLILFRIVPLIEETTLYRGLQIYNVFFVSYKLDIFGLD